MKILLELGVCCLLAGSATAQRGGMGGGFRGGSGGFSGVAGRFGGRAGRFIGNRSYFGGGLLNYGSGYPAYYGGDYWTPISDASESAPGNVIIVPVLPPEPPPPPPPPARPVIHEYHWPTVNSNDTATVFSIVLNDKTVHYATMVWIDGEQLRFINSRGGSGQISRASISRDLTYQANPGKNLKAWLP
jgi:hypothetical protein